MSGFSRARAPEHCDSVAVPVGTTVGSTKARAPEHCDSVAVPVGTTVKPRYNAGRGRKNFEAKNRVIARSAL